MIEPRFIEKIAKEINVKSEQVAAAVALFSKGATIPFVARYRKDATGGLSENKLEKIEERNDYFVALSAKRDALLDNIEKQGRLTEDLKAAIYACEDQISLEDLSLPFKKQRNNRAAIAANKGLLPLADYIWAQSAISPPPTLYAESFVSPDKQVLSVEEALEGARHILAECIALNADLRREVRSTFETSAKLTVHLTKVDEEKNSRYKSFENYSKPIQEVPEEEFLLLVKGERDNSLRLTLEIDDDQLIQTLAMRFIQDPEGAYAVEIREAVSDAYKRLLRPVIEEEVFTAHKRKAEDIAIANARDHLRNLLMMPPAGSIPVLGVCCWTPKVRGMAVIDGSGNLVASHMVQAETEEELDKQAGDALLSLLEQHSVEGIVVSSGPGGREMMRLAVGLVLQAQKRTFVTLVQDLGVAAYVHSTLASEELPDLDDSIRAAVSIARRFQDPLKELVKVDPSSLVPLRYAMGVSRKRLQAGVVRTLESAINRVGVDANLASVSQLRYVSGLQLGVAQSIIEKRTELGGFKNREQLLQVSGIAEKTYQQCAGFIRISGGDNPLDNSAIHPEFYPAVQRILEALECSIENVKDKVEAFKQLDKTTLADDLVGPLALEDIFYELGRIGRDPRRKFRPPHNHITIKSLDSLESGMVLEGIVTNVTDFGVFVSLGIQHEGLVHRSEVGKAVMNDSKRPIQVGDVVKVRVLQVDKETPKIALSIKDAIKLPLSRPRPRRAAPDPVTTLRRDDMGREREGSIKERSVKGTVQQEQRGDTAAAQRLPRRKGKDYIAVPKIDKAAAKKEDMGLLNTSLADQLAALRDKIAAGKK